MRAKMIELLKLGTESMRPPDWFSSSIIIMRLYEWHSNRYFLRAQRQLIGCALAGMIRRRRQRQRHWRDDDHSIFRNSKKVVETEKILFFNKNFDDFQLFPHSFSKFELNFNDHDDPDARSISVIAPMMQTLQRQR